MALVTAEGNLYGAPHLLRTWSSDGAPLKSVKLKAGCTVDVHRGVAVVTQGDKNGIALIDCQAGTVLAPSVKPGGWGKWDCAAIVPAGKYDARPPPYPHLAVLIH